MNEIVGHRIKTLRKAKNLKQIDLARIVQAAGYSLTPSFLCRIEQGSKGMSIRVAAAIAQALDVSLDEIVSEDESPEPEAVHA